jgi:hypothetical protein
MSGVWRYPQRPKGGKFGLGRAKSPQWNDGRQGASDARLAPVADRFDWKPEVEVVVGPPRKRQHVGACP